MYYKDNENLSTKVLWYLTVRADVSMYCFSDVSEYILHVT